jgi:outer membrane protein assembly factor BamB
VLFVLWTARALAPWDESIAGDVSAAASGEDATVNDDWPFWRGPNRNNHSNGPAPPTHWGAESNILWKTEVPGRGHASPCIVSGRVFLASCDQSSGTQFIVCFDAQNGGLLWRSDLHQGVLPKIHENNTHASATPASDGQRVFAVFANSGELHVSCVDLAGEVVWQKRIGAYRHANGYGASPTVFESVVIIASDNQEEPCILALNRADGEVVWRIERPRSDTSATPIVATVAGRPQLLTNGANAVVSYDPATGDELWRVNHNTEVVANTMTFDAQAVYASGNVPEKHLMAIRADGRGDVSQSHVLWRLNQSNPYVPSPLICGDLLFTVLDGGSVVCREADSGKELWHKRLEGTFFSSPVVAGELIFAVNDDGATFVFRADRQFELVAENELKERCFATPAICGGRLHIRTAENLYCIGTR